MGWEDYFPSSQAIKIATFLQSFPPTVFSDFSFQKWTLTPSRFPELGRTVKMTMP